MKTAKNLLLHMGFALSDLFQNIRKQYNEAHTELYI